MNPATALAIRLRDYWWRVWWRRLYLRRFRRRRLDFLRYAEAQDARMGRGRDR